MYLLVGATPLEIEPAVRALTDRSDIDFLLSGVGPVEAAFSLTRYLSRHTEVSGVINFGVAGAYPGSGPELLDLCVADNEMLADLGICCGDRVEPFDENSLTINREFDLRNRLFEKMRIISDRCGISLTSGRFLTVSCASGSAARGENLYSTYQSICENMEGAALARVCAGFGLDFFEMRCVSNMVEDRNPAKWRLHEACARAGNAVAKLIGMAAE